MTDTLKARPTTYKGTRMRSRLEAGFAAWLDQRGFVWEYEPGAFASDKGQYFPDFLLRDVVCSWRSQPATVYVEVKPTRPTKVVASAMTIIWETDPDAVLAITTPERQGRHGGSVTLVHRSTGSPEHADIIPALWIVTGPNSQCPGIAAPYPSTWCPWPDEYWKVGS